MTVRELIAKLQQCDPDREVHIETYDRHGDSIYGHAQAVGESKIANVVLIDNLTVT